MLGQAQLALLEADPSPLSLFLGLGTHMYSILRVRLTKDSGKGVDLSGRPIHGVTQRPGKASGPALVLHPGPAVLHRQSRAASVLLEERKLQERSYADKEDRIVVHS